MGANDSKSQYSIPITKKKEGETAIYRHPIAKDGFPSLSKKNLKTLQDVYLWCNQHYGNKTLFASRDPTKGNKYVEKTFPEVTSISRNLGSGILNLSLETREKIENIPDLAKIAVYSKNREEWMLVDIACVLYRLQIVSLYDSLGEQASVFILSQTNVKTIFSTKPCIESLLKLSGLGNLQNIVSFDEIDENLKKKIADKGLKYYHLSEIINNGKEKPQEYVKIEESDIFTFSYTSGTTGNPKGALLSHGNLISSIIALENTNIKVLKNDRHLSYLPLPHIFERVAVWNFLFLGANIYFFGGDVLKIKEDLADVKPNFFISVPRLYNKFYDIILGNMSKLTGIKKYLSDKAVSTKVENVQKNGSYEHFFYDKLVFSKVKSVFGGNCRFVLTASAPLSPDVLNFLKIALSCPFFEGYGQTESTGASFATFGNKI